MCIYIFCNILIAFILHKQWCIPGIFLRSFLHVNKKLMNQEIFSTVEYRYTGNMIIITYKYIGNNNMQYNMHNIISCEAITNTPNTSSSFRIHEGVSIVTTCTGRQTSHYRVQLESPLQYWFQHMHQKLPKNGLESLCIKNYHKNHKRQKTSLKRPTLRKSDQKSN